MASVLKYILGYKSTNTLIDPTYAEDDTSVSVAESVTAGAVCNSLCAEPGASSYFKGGITAYSIASKKEILGIDTKYAEKHNFANPFTTVEMAKAVTKLFKSRFGIATTGYSLPFHRPENKDREECELNIDVPYAYICLYDARTNEEITIKEEVPYDPNGSKAVQRANLQARIAILATKLYKEKVEKINNSKQ